LMQSTDRLNRVTKYGYNSLQQLVEVTEPAGHKTQYSYCGCGSLNGITDGNWNTTTFIRDLEERLTQKIYADNSIVAVNYDVGGRLSSVVKSKPEPNSESESFAYSYSYSYSMSERRLWVLVGRGFKTGHWDRSTTCPFGQDDTWQLKLNDPVDQRLTLLKML
jgi:YD repeat-containing protein